MLGLFFFTALAQKNIYLLVILTFYVVDHPVIIRNSYLFIIYYSCLSIEPDFLFLSYLHFFCLNLYDSSILLQNFDVIEFII